MAPIRRRHLLAAAGGLSAAALVGCSRTDEGPRPGSVTPSSKAPSSSAPSSAPSSASIDPRLDGTIAEGLNAPWGIAFLPGGDALVAQRDEGTIVRIEADGGAVRTLGTVEGSVGRPGGEGGLLGLVVDPDDESTLFAYIATQRDNRVVRLRLDDDGLSRPTPVLTGIPLGTRHHGGRLLFGPDGSLYVSTGEAGRPELAQDRSSLGGKVLRIDRDGGRASGSPFGTRIWTWGHRNVEGLAFDADGRLWASEFGDKKADELNLIRRGRNYGWPEVEGKGGGDRFTSPSVTWAPDDCSPGGLAITRSTAFVPALQGECVWMVPLDGASAGTPRAILKGHGRLRTAVVAPDDSLWVTTSNTDGRGDPTNGDDRILRVTL